MKARLSRPRASQEHDEFKRDTRQSRPARSRDRASDRERFSDDLSENSRSKDGASAGRTRLNMPGRNLVRKHTTDDKSQPFAITTVAKQNRKDKPPSYNSQEASKDHERSFGRRERTFDAESAQKTPRFVTESTKATYKSRQPDGERASKIVPEKPLNRAERRALLFAKPKSERKVPPKDEVARDGGRDPDPALQRLTFGGEDSSEHARERQRDRYPISVPYTTAASVFLYGASPVLAALKSRSRKLYTLFIHRRSAAGAQDRGNDIHRLALGVPPPFKIRNVEQDFLRVMDKMSAGRPHNGVVLEASPLPLPPVVSLGKISPEVPRILLSLAPQSSEDLAVNGAPLKILIQPSPWRRPLVVVLDGILDPGNLGNILRTCHFYGVDAIAICVNTCAPLSSPAVIKASAGASEAVRILAIHKPADFVAKSRAAGWKVHAAVAPELRRRLREERRVHVLKTSTMRSPVAKHPCLLLLGAEGEGLRRNLRDKADYEVVVDRAGGGMDVGVDSINVSVAAGVLLEAFMRRPSEASVKVSGGDEAGGEGVASTGENESLGF
ncbi:hypothetical protein LTR66_006643 [Elasticomyces elasticus]|nr:hypothetical protein LTR66_006643 [Elasticomyces elasticus]